MQTKIQIKALMLSLLLSFVIGLPLLAEESIAPATATTAASTSLLEMQDKIAQKKKEIENLKKQSDIYEQNIKIKQQEAVNLKNQVDILDNRIAKLRVDIKKTETEIDETILEVEDTEENISLESTRIAKQKEILGELMRRMYRDDSKNRLEILVLNNSFSDFFNQFNYLETASEDLQGSLSRIQKLKLQLESQKRDLSNKRKSLEDFKIALESKKDNLAEQMSVKSNLLAQTKNSEQKFRSLLTQLKQEQQQVDFDIIGLEKTVREKLELSKIGSLESGFAWPVDPGRGITAYFHDKDYPFNYIFLHPAIDIRTPQGTPVRAAGSGYVARAKNNGYGYNYIMLVHDKGFSTVYGHVSRILVKENTYVKQGDIIALSGGLPGTLGAGRLTTGAHLHFEVRLNSAPVDPLKYLP